MSLACASRHYQHNPDESRRNIQGGEYIISVETVEAEIVELDKYDPKAIARSTALINGLIQGKNYTQIAQELGIDRKTLYRHRQSLPYEQFLNDLLDIQFQELAELSKDPKTRIAAMKERGLIIRAAVTKRVHQRTEKAEIKIILHDFNPNQPTPKENETE